MTSTKLERMVIFVGISLLCAGCAPATPLPPVALAEDADAAVQSAIRARLRDPESAKFSRMRAGTDAKDGATVVCGMVNSKNGFGGYAGPAPFQVRAKGGSYQIDAIDTAGSGPGLAFFMCRNNGLI